MQIHMEIVQSDYWIHVKNKDLNQGLDLGRSTIITWAGRNLDFLFAFLSALLVLLDAGTGL